MRSFLFSSVFNARLVNVRLGRVLALFALLGCLAESACSISMEDACSAYATSTCNLLGRCQPSLLKMLYGDKEQCVTRRKLICPLLFPPSSLTTPGDVKDCADALDASACTASSAPSACNPKAGNLPDGAACGADSQCASTYCERSVGQCGTCVRRMPLGKACDTSLDCDFGLVCLAQASGGRTCVATTIVGAGQSCGMGKDCQPGLICSNSATPKCMTPLMVGATCDPANSACDGTQGSICDPQSKKCINIQYAAVGQPCEEGAALPTTCMASAQCSNQGSSSICVAPAADGKSCNPTASIGCMSPATCQNGVCALFDPASCH